MQLYVNYAPTSRMLIDNANILNRKMIKAKTYRYRSHKVLRIFRQDGENYP